MNNNASLPNDSATGPANASDVFDELKRSFSSEMTRPIQWRVSQLRNLKQLLLDNQTQIIGALKQDLAKSDFECWSSELGPTISEIDFALKNIKRWSRKRRVKTPLVAQPGKSYLMPEPLGVVLIIGAWNYPLYLSLSPLVSAIAAGNCAIVKPSEVAQNTSRLIATMFKELSSPAYRVVEGGVTETTELLKQPFNHIFYTGGEAVGKIVMRAAAENLTPVTLELGGKSPCIVDSDTNWDRTSSRVVWSKFMNAGQTCVAPDYVIVESRDLNKLVEALSAKIHAFYGEDTKQNQDYGRIINRRHAERIASYLQGAEIAFGGKVDLDELYIEPTLVVNPNIDSLIMTNEIFGPILPIITVDSINDAIPLINQRAKPLALYLYTKNKAFEELVLSSTSAGSVAVNDGMMFMANPNLPFGGVGNSGMGASHGQFGFNTFSHLKSVINRGTLLDPNFRYPPFNKTKLSLIRKIFGG